jgi:hypothetical protein
MSTSIPKGSDPVFNIVDNVLKQIFGERVTQLIYRYLETHHSLPQSEFSSRIEDFAKGLEIFLQTGAPIIERKILKDIYACYGLIRRMELADMHEEQDFASQVRIIMQRA